MKTLVAGLLLACAVLAVYQPVIEGEFLWDDAFLVETNPFIRSPTLAWESFQHWLYEDEAASYYRPVQTLSYLPDYLAWNLDPAGYHLTNILLHALAAWMVFLVLARLLPDLLPPCAPGTTEAMGGWARRLGPGGLAFGISLLWAVHPLHNAAVAYIAGRADPLAAIFALAAWWLQIRAGRLKPGALRPLLLVAAFLATVAALGAKEIALVWIAWFVVWQWGFARAASLRSKIFSTASAGAAVLVWLGLRALPAPSLGSAAPLPWTAVERLLLCLRALGDYCATLLVPLHLQMERVLLVPGSGFSATAWATYPELEVLTWTGLIAALALGLACLRRGEYWRVRRAGVAWFAVGFVPFSHLLPIGNAQAAEHWIYMPSLGLLLCMAGALMEARGARHGVAVAALFLIALAGWGWRTHLRAADWTTRLRFFESSVQAGANTPRVWLNLAVARAESGDIAGARAVLEFLARLYPGYGPAAVFSAAISGPDPGVSAPAAPPPAQSASGPEMRGGVPADPRGWRASLVRARTRVAAGDLAGARDQLEHARRIYRDRWRLVEMEASIAALDGDLSRAQSLLHTYLRRADWDARAHRLQARFHLEAGDPEAALRALDTAADLDWHDTDALEAAARIHLAQSRPGEAAELLARAVRRCPDSPRLRLDYAGALDASGDAAEARRQEARAEELMATVSAPARR